eukprot:m.292481 g.292481  ORF g.292481 m.292481 type:complete len:291 (+) comp19487_c0_seq1:609-1481(+)
MPNERSSPRRLPRRPAPARRFLPHGLSRPRHCCPQRSTHARKMPQGRSGFDGPWTANPLRFDNDYFKNLLRLKWTPRKWDGPLQYEDPSGQLMMLPTDLALVEDAGFRPFVQLYANDQEQWFHDFSFAFSRLLSNGCPARCNPALADVSSSDAESSPVTHASQGFLANCMHGSLELAKQCLARGGNLHAVETSSGRTALHKAAFWGHEHIVAFLLQNKIDVNATDFQGDTALHDAVRFGHNRVVSVLLDGGADPKLKNKLDQDAAGVARAYNQSDTLALLSAPKTRPARL